MNRSFFLRVFGVLLIVAGLGFFAYLYYQDNKQVKTPLVFADRTMLNALWDDYKQEYWESGSGRTLDKQQNDITTSEGQSYTMMRAVWMGDKEVFDKTYEFSRNQLQHKDDKLFAWRWGLKSDGTYGVLTEQNGQNAASDGDQDIAFALLMAANRWQQNSYREDARSIIKDIWEHEVIVINDIPYLTANDLENESETEKAILNPSYFAPYAYREFAKVDRENNWGKLVDSSYDVIKRSSEAKLGSPETVGLPPDWVLIDKQSGELSPPTQENLTTNFSYDAMRTSWRLAMDHQWYKEPRAKQTLEKFDHLSKEWERSGKLISTYSHDGKQVVKDEVPFAYGTAIGYFKVADPDNAQAVYDQKIKSLYDPSEDRFKERLSYYDDNWTWFGIGLYTEALPNLAQKP